MAVYALAQRGKGKGRREGEEVRSGQASTHRREKIEKRRKKGRGERRTQAVREAGRHEELTRAACTQK